MNTTAEKAASETYPPARDGKLVSPEWLQAHLADPGVRVIEVDVSAAHYAEGHIDGAVLWNVYADLKDAEYRLVDTAARERLMQRSGIEPGSTVVFYGYAPALGVWLMELCGHGDARILDCSREAWREGGRPWSSSGASPASTGYRVGGEVAGLRADRAAVRTSIGSPRRILLDVRSEAEYRGERFWPSGGLQPDGRAGHVPSAVHQPIDGLYNPDGSFRSAAELSSIFTSLDLDGDEQLITYCTIGGRAATAWFVLTYLLGRQQVRVYDGSWAEWGRASDSPVERS